MKFKSFEELLDELLRELRRLRIWAEDIVKRMQENCDTLDTLDMNDPASLERFHELLKEFDELKAEFARFEEEFKETMKKNDALTGGSRKP